MTGLVQERALVASALLWVGWLAAHATVGCSGDRDPAPQEQIASLPPGAVARVGQEIIDEETVRRIAAAKGLSPQQARSAAIYDALRAQEAVRLGLASDPVVRVEERGVLAHGLLRKMKEQASQTPPTNEEIERLTAEHWLDLDRPEARRTAHALVRTEETDSPQRLKDAQALAQRLASAVQGIREPDRFVETAKQVPSQGFEILAEKLGPVTADGRIADLEQRPEPGRPPQVLDKQFVASVFRLKELGEQSAPVQTPFGWHVILLTGFQPGQTYSAEERARLLRDEVLSLRARELFDKELEALKRRIPTRVERNAGTLMNMLAAPAKDR